MSGAQKPMVDSYDVHPSAELRALFASMPVPYQGQEPHIASVIFVGLDANYSAEVFDHPRFREKIFEYHRDGIAFWRRYGVHHPFLLDEYPLRRDRGGVPYHRNFSGMGLPPELADKISFIELLSVPTIGSTDKSRFWELFDIEHAKCLDRLFKQGSRRQVLLPDSVIRRMQLASRKYGVFDWLPKHVDKGLFTAIGNTQFHKVIHFSAAISKETLTQMGQMIRTFCAAQSKLS